jgi:hypothetical protein
VSILSSNTMGSDVLLLLNDFPLEKSLRSPLYCLAGSLCLLYATSVMSSSMSELLSPPLDSDDDALLFLVENSLIDPDYI